MTSRTIVVTGGASGIGSAIVAAFEQAGDRVIVVDRNEPDFPSSFVACDLTDPASIERAVAGLPASIDVLVNSAGVSGLVPIPTVMAVNFYGLRSLTEALVSRIVDGGCVVSIASTSGWFWRDHLGEVKEIIAAREDAEIADVISRFVTDGYTAYARSKEAVIVWSTAAAQENLVECASTR